MKKNNTEIRHDWSSREVLEYFSLPLSDLIYEAQTIHRNNFDPNSVQLSTLLSIKTGSCPEDCSYCPQSAHYNVGLKKERLLPIEKVLEAARNAKKSGSSRFCMGAAWKSPTDKDLDKVCEMIEEVNKLGLETCATLGMLKDRQADKLLESGLDYYNHNIDTSEGYYDKIITTRKFKDRIDTLDKVRKAGIKVCSGGIVGLGESETDRAEMLRTLSNLAKHPESVPINLLIKIPGTPLENCPDLNPLDLIKTIAVARIIMPESFVRLSAGRTEMSQSTQALAFLAGANSIFQGDQLLVTPNPKRNEDIEMFDSLGIKPLEINQMKKPYLKNSLGIKTKVNEKRIAKNSKSVEKNEKSLVSNV